MKPLSSVAMGLVIVVLVARFGGYDALPDPLGWLLVLWGVRRLPDPALLLRLAALAAGSGDVKAAAWQRTTMVLNAVLAVLPVLVFASGSEQHLSTIYAAAAAVVILLIVLLFIQADRPWAPDTAPIGSA